MEKMEKMGRKVSEAENGEGANPALVQPGWCDDDKETEGGLFPNTVTLSTTERRINSNAAFRGFKKENMKIQRIRFANADFCNLQHQCTPTRLTRSMLARR